MDLQPNADRFTGFADKYNAYRPQPPIVVIDILTQLAQMDRPKLVVDLGCGTGLSTRIWADRAEEVIGVEPSADMRREAESKTATKGLRNVRYIDGWSYNTGLPDGCADIVTCSQSLHWMEPESTFAEVARILRPGGVFASIDCDWPPMMKWEVAKAYSDFMKNIRETECRLGVYNSVQRWAKNEHLARMESSGQFRYTHEVVVHNVEYGNADRLVGLALSFGSVQDVLKRGVTDKEAGLDQLREIAECHIGSTPIPWYFSYRVRFGVK